MLKTNTKTTKLGKLLLCGLFSALPLACVQAQTTNYTTNFGTGYTTGGLAGQNGWTVIGTSVVAPIQVNATTGLVTVAAASGEDDNVAFATNAALTGTTGTLTAAYNNLSITAAGTGGSYSLALSGGLGSTLYTGRVYAKSTTGGYLLGITLAGANIVYGTTVQAFNTPINLTVDYGVNSGTNDDTLSISVGGILYATYATAFDYGTTGNGSATLGSVLLRQDSATATALTLGGVTVTSNLVAAPAPEPGTCAMIGLGTLGTMLLIRRRKVRA